MNNVKLLGIKICKHGYNPKRAHIITVSGIKTMRNKESINHLGRRLRTLKPFDPWNNPLCTCPFKLSLNPYTGCSIGCKYCYATAYIGLRSSKPKQRIARLLIRDLEKVDPRIPINMGTSSDPYPPEERELGITREILGLLVPEGRRILITTKGVLYSTRDIDLISRGNVAVTPTITTMDSGIARMIEPLAPEPLERISAAENAISNGVPVGVRVDPIIPFVNDDEYEIMKLIETLSGIGVRFIVTSTYKARPDNLSRMKELGDIGRRIYRLYKENGVWYRGYIYLPKDYRIRLLKPVIETAKKYGLEYATCREGLEGREWINAGSCDGIHLIPNKLRPKASMTKRLTWWIDNSA